MKPQEVLDLSIDTLNACARGYTDYIFDLQTIGVTIGYYSGYYMNAKHAKPPAEVIKSMVRKRDKVARGHASEIDVESFQAREERLYNILEGR